MIEKNNLTLSLKIGTSGYSYDDWRNHFYPPEIPRYRTLAFYCQYFRTVEINSTYYKIPNLKSIEKFAEKTPAEFEFIIKMNRETTHNRRENEQAIRQLVNALRPLAESGKCKGLLAQFPYSFKNNETNRYYLVQTKKYAEDLALFVEFRHKSWNTQQIFPFLKENNIGYVNVDEPKLEGLLPAQSVAATKTGYVRFHGRNAEKWWDGKGSERYDYLYNEDELKSWVTHINELMRKTYKTYIFFNNHPRGQAVQNAKQMFNLLNVQLSANL